MAFWYLGAPYSRYPGGMYGSFRDCCLARGLLIRHGIPVFSPVIHSHYVAGICGMDPVDHSIWLPAERPIMEAACGLIVLMLEGWEKSYGLQQEIEFFIKEHLPITYMTPGVVPDVGEVA